jgi:hypothetical protein
MRAGLHFLARALGGDASHNPVLAPALGHSSDDRSLSVRLDPRARGGVLVIDSGQATSGREGPRPRILDLVGHARPRDITNRPV